MIFNNIYRLVQAIPSGKVTTYGGIAKILKISPRVVGWALHKNPDPVSIPCHRVVNKDGRLAKSFAFGGEEGQKMKLEEEGVCVYNNQVDLEIYLWNGKD